VCETDTFHSITNVPLQGIIATCAAANRDASLIVVGDNDGRVHVFSGSSHSIVGSHEVMAGGGTRAVSILPDGQSAIAAATLQHTGRFVAISLDSGIVTELCPPGSKSVSNFCVQSSIGSVLAWGSYPAIDRFNLKTFAHEQRYDAGDGWIPDVALSPKGDAILSGDTYHRVRLWNAQGSSGTTPALIAEHDQDVFSVDFCDVSELAATAGNDAIKIWRIQPSTPFEPQRSMAIAANEKIPPLNVTVVAANEISDPANAIWHFRNARIERTLWRHEGILAVTLTDDGRFAASVRIDIGCNNRPRDLVQLIHLL
jgi:WD40 repeat protein